MRIAWFRASRPGPAALLDETGPIIATLRRSHHLDVITEREAHDFVWTHFRTPYDVCVYELGNSPAHKFLGAYLPHYPGIVASRGLGVPEPPSPLGSHVRSSSHGTLTLGLLDDERAEVVQRAAQRARTAGIDVDVLDGEPERVLHAADVVVATEWPPRGGALTIALLGMAARKTVVVLEVEATAAWPALDPQTWQPRGWSTDPPIVVALDPRDEEHSLLLTIKRLAADAPLRDSLAAAAHAWWRAHATLDHAVGEWERILAEAAAAHSPAAHAADHGDGVRATLEQFGVRVDFLDVSLRSPDSGPDRRP